MPPRKRVRVSALASATPPSAAKSPTPDAATAPADSPTKDPLLDAWTDEEEAALFRGLMRYKPTGKRDASLFIISRVLISPDGD